MNRKARADKRWHTEKCQTIKQKKIVHTKKSHRDRLTQSLCFHDNDINFISFLKNIKRIIINDLYVYLIKRIIIHMY